MIEITYLDGAKQERKKYAFDSYESLNAPNKLAWLG